MPGPVVDVDAHAAAVDHALAVLLDPALEPIVEFVVRRVDAPADAPVDPGGPVVEVAAVDGSVRFRRDGAGAVGVVAVEGRNPLANTDAGYLAGVAAERATPRPPRHANAYPFGYEHLAQLFGHPAAPDLCVVHTAAHNWEDRGGHRGEHGSPGVIQARGPFVLAGAGVRALGAVPRACRMIDVAPTLAALLGVAPADATGPTLLAGSEGEPRTDVLDPGRRPEHLVCLLLDGANANVLYGLARAGLAPNLARLMGMGTTFEWGVVASLPTVTLANHTTALTGAHPGSHGILHNAWWDRAAGRQVVTNSPQHWPSAMDHLAPGFETLHHGVRRTWPGSVTAALNEPVDAGATLSTFARIRSGATDEAFPRDPHGLPHSTERFVRPHKDYGFFTQVDHFAVVQATGLFAGRWAGASVPLPRLVWVSLSLTDSAFHLGGPHSEVAAAAVADTDGRIGEILAAVEAAGVFDDTAFCVLADHGMQETDPDVRGDWDDALAEAGVRFRDEGYGFVYLDPGAT